MSISDDRWHQLGVLRETVTKTVGALHDAQVYQLKMWPLAMFPLVSHEIHIHLESSSISYQFKFKKNAQRPRNMKKRFAILEGSIQAMLGSHWLVTVSEGKKALFTGTRKVDVRRDPKI